MDYILCNIAVLINCQSKGGYFCVAQFSQMFWRIKTNFIARRQSPNCNFMQKSYCETKSLANIEERSPTECGVPSVYGKQEEVALSFYEEAAEYKR